MKSNRKMLELSKGWSDAELLRVIPVPDHTSCANAPEIRPIPLTRSPRRRSIRLAAQSGTPHHTRSRRSGAVDTAQAQAMAAGTHENASGSRDYMLYVPSAYASGAQAMPLVVMLHGCGQSSADFAAGTRMNQLAEEYGFLVAYPEQAFDANRLRCWNWFSRSDQQRDRGEPALIAGITKQIMDEYRIDGSRVYIAGMSAGGSMAAIMAHTYPDIYAAAGVHSGTAYGHAQSILTAILAMRHGTQPKAASMLDLPEKEEAAAQSQPVRPATAPSTIVFHGDMDKTVHLNNSDQVIAGSAPYSSLGLPPPLMGTEIRHAQPADGHAYTQTIYLDGQGRDVAEHWVVHGAGHGWSGGDPDGSYTEPQGPDASREMLRFFLAHPRRAG